MTQALLAKLSTWRRSAAANPNFPRGLLGAGAVAALDQATKYWIVRVADLPAIGRIEVSSIFDLTYVENRGASFGMLAGGLGSRILLAAISIGVVVALIGWLGGLTRRFAILGVALIVGGALGNLYDRVAYGYVVDFLDFSGLYFPWVFNVADAAINVGVACLVLDAMTTKNAGKNVDGAGA